CLPLPPACRQAGGRGRQAGKQLTTKEYLPDPSEWQAGKYIWHEWLSWESNKKSIFRDHRR
ncbi:MAG: hypothetical protein V3T88_09035, partial [Nitrosomonadaceae bacterium]